MSTSTAALAAQPYRADDPLEAGELETLDEAIAEVRRKFVLADKERNSLKSRLDVLLMDSREHRRRYARNVLDSYLLPITFYSIEYADEGSPEAVLRSALDEVTQLWLEKYPR
jgi:hypothetical protein